MKKERLSRHPLSYIEGQSIIDLPFAGIIIHTVDSHMQVMYIQEGDTVYGARYQIGAVERFTVEGIQDPIRVSGFLQAVNAEYEKVERILNKAGFDTADLMRTWHYIYPINEYYSLFNHERRLFFERSNIDYIKRPECVPASTCIEGKCRGEGYSSMNLYYIRRTDHVRIQRLYNDNQLESDSMSYPFNPTFSRALYLEQPGLKELQISGTASIGEDGITQHHGDPDHQIERTLLMVKGLLEQADMGFNDICYATCIFKNPSNYSIFHEVVQRLELPNFPLISIKGNICRDDLLFELDGIAARGSKYST